MPRRSTNTRSYTAYSNGRGQSYRGGSQGPSTERGGRLSYGGRVISRNERYRNIRRALGMSAS